VAGMEIWYVFRGINTKLDYKVKNFDVDIDFMKNKMPFLWLCWVKIACQNLKSAIISDRKAISSQLLSSLSVLEFIFKHIFALKIL
jgi:hypothetical protein